MLRPIPYAPLRTVAVPALLLFAGCSSSSEDAGPELGDASGHDVEAADRGPAEVETSAPDVAADPQPDSAPLPETCPDGLPSSPFLSGPSGVRRHELAADFLITRIEGATWRLSEHWTGCDNIIFVPDNIPLSDVDRSSIWTADVDLLIERSPRNTHYVFVSLQRTEEAEDEATRALSHRIENALAELSAEDDAWWFDRLHVVSTRAGTLGSWIDGVMQTGVGRLGFAIDREQRIRGIGSFADVTRFDSEAQAAGGWPWRSNLAYAAHEAVRFNREAVERDRIAGLDATEIVLWNGEVLSQFAEIDATLPEAATMAGFDTFEIDVSQNCPNPDQPEPNNCGAWDYIARFSLVDPAGSRTELARHITTYHREGWWTLDASPLLPLLRDGGPRRFRWEWAPEWNVQPTATRVVLRFANQGRATRPFAATPLFSGGAFNGTYNDGREPLSVPVPADATRVELFALITGHGGETENCAEFCNHQHEFDINGSIHLRDHPAVGDDEACLEQIADGAVPNQWGTWWFGRGGWCPGMQVAPWIVDVTSDVTAGENATVRYRGLLHDATPPDASGNIDMASWLVFYR